MNVIAHRVFLFGIGRPFLRSLVAPLFSILFAVAMADTVTDWSLTRQRIASLPPWIGAVMFTGLVLAWSIVAGRALRPVWQKPVIRFLVRQPLTRWQWVVLLIPSLSIAFAPVAAIWWLAPRSSFPFLHYVGFVGLAWPMILGASGTGATALLLTGASSLVLALAIFGYLYFPAMAIAAVVVTIAELPLGVALIPRQIRQKGGRVSGHLAGRDIVAVLVRRDVRCLVRLDPKRLLGAWGFGLVASLMMLAFRINGGVEGVAAFRAACVLLTIAALPLYELQAVVKRNLGREIMRRRWPVTYAQRGAAIVALVGIVIGPSAMLILLFGATMNFAYLVLYVMFAASTAMLTAAFFATRLVVKRNDIGWFYLLLLCHAMAAFFLPAWAYAGLAAASVASCVGLIRRGLHRFCDAMESAVEQAA